MRAKEQKEARHRSSENNSLIWRGGDEPATFVAPLVILMFMEQRVRN